ncbi:hypothetical protein BGW37DRAFT_279493 [Umbelopsis sp. PMI_123]|nr:hypothetical protein BGW37DRAFT_279493 [Umbelopsis sp. PMI_123]
MSLAQFRLIYPSGSISVAISIEDGIPKPLAKSKDGLFELNRQLLRGTKYNYQLFLDDEPQQIQVFDTSTAKPEDTLNNLKGLNSLFLIDMNAKEQPISRDTEGVVITQDDTPEFGHSDGHSDSETVGSELDSPLTPTRLGGFEEENAVHSILNESKDLKSDGYNTSLSDSINLDPYTPILIEHASPIASENKDEITAENNVLETSIPGRGESDDQPVLPSPTNEEPLSNGETVNLQAHDTEDELDDRCIVDDLIEELREKEAESKLRSSEHITAEAITMQMQAISKFGPADTLRLESMFASFIMIIILQAVANAFSFAKASLD